MAVKTKADTLPAVSVTGYINGGSYLSAKDLERKSNALLNAVSAETIGQSADLTIADVSQRVSGLTVTKSSTGESNKTIIRGIDPKYNYTMVNGVVLPSPDDRNRYLSLSLFPAEMVERVEVYKTLTPDMEGGALGGVVNLVMKTAPNGAIISGKAALGYNSFFFNHSYTGFNTKSIQLQSPYERFGSSYNASVKDFSKSNLNFDHQQSLPDGIANLIITNRFFARKLGVILSGDYQHLTKGADGYFIPQNAGPQINNRPNLTNFSLRNYNNTVTRIGIHNKYDYKLNDRHNFSIYQFYIRQAEAEARNEIDTNLMQGRSIPGTGRIDQYNRSRVHFQNIYNIALQGKDSVNKFIETNWVLSYASANGGYPDWAELGKNTSRLLQPDGSISQTPSLLSPLTRAWLRNKEKDWTETVHIVYRPAILHNQLILQGGWMHRSKRRDNFYNAYYFIPAQTTANGQPFTDIYQALWLGDAPQNPLGNVGNSNTFRGKEDINAAYLQLKTNLRKLMVTAGLRWENTLQHITSSVNPSLSFGKEVNIQYADFLPAIHTVYPLSKKEQLRASWFKGLTRPALYDLSFYSIQYEDAVVVGNPFLKRTKVDNFDLRYDYYLAPQSSFQATLFYKRIYDPFEKALLNTNDELYPIPSQGLSYTPAGQFTEQLRNFGNANVYGLELNYVATFHKINIDANYTFTHSTITTTKKFNTREVPNITNSNIITISKEESRPLQGQSPHNANLSILYKDTLRGFIARVALTYTSQRIYSVSDWFGLDYWQKGYAQADIFLQQKMGRHWLLFVKLNNLLNTGARVYIHQPNTDWGVGLLPGQDRSDQIRVLRENAPASFLVGVSLW